MMIKYCNYCVGKPYSEDLTLSSCPVCGKALSVEFLDSGALVGRPKLSVSPVKNVVPGGPLSNSSPDNTSINSLPIPEGASPGLFPVTPDGTGNVPAPPAPDTIPIPNNTTVIRTGRMTITGKVSGYSSSGREDGSYRRLFIFKVIDAVIYHQRLEDVLHRFNVRVENGKDTMGYSQYSDIPVNVHGTIASGMQITDNAEVEVEGKYRNGVLMASKVSVVNNGCYSQIKFQRSIPAIIYGVLTALAAIALIVFVANTDGNFFANLKSFLLTWLVVSIVTAVLYLVLIFSKIGFFTRMTTGKPKKFPIVGILLFSLIITMIFMNSFGIGASLSGLFSKLLIAIMPAAIIIIAIIFILKLIFK